MDRHNVVVGVLFLAGALGIGSLVQAQRDRRESHRRLDQLRERMEACDDITRQTSAAVKHGASRDEVIALERDLWAQYHATYGHGQ